MGCLLTIMALFTLFFYDWKPALLILLLAWFITPKKDRKIEVVFRAPPDN